ncbi:hypothetical protein C8A05DRAFT_48433 [Staphylotrichum tortipilum]|uniref:Aminoglycoside phosphotransferase domain-containing protein n=1 Tax=Staphylotrichum tortipilum TaxID=2831512 RepID=A0AAN6MAR8_9PEZI|nr:hypothetical protein C8A05DRAFT_48433 [Staphylotrichum longicolle]
MQPNLCLLCLIASRANRGRKCVALDLVAGGMNHVVRVMKFQGGVRWAARVRVKPASTPATATRDTRAGMRGKGRRSSRPATMRFIRKSGLPVPRVLPGIVAMDALGGHRVHRGVIPARCRPRFYRDVAAFHVRGYTSGLIPGIGGPFHAAAAFFSAWADTVRFKRSAETITKLLQRTPPSIITAERMTSITTFPAQIRALAESNRLDLMGLGSGPFPLCHDDFLYSNIMVDESDFSVTALTGIIVWERACTMPWELVGFPEFLQVMLRAFDLPGKYDEQGQPVGKELRETWRERGEYVDMVLGNSRCQALAYAYGAYMSVGKLGFYDRVVEELERGA